MIVQLIASTVVTGWGHMRDAGWQDYLLGEDDYGIDVAGVDTDGLAEFAGRLCYQSWSRPNPATATNDGYLAHIIDSQHFSVLEHSSATFYVAGVSRSLSHELVRHRHLSFSQVSQRYVNETMSSFVEPPAISDLISFEAKRYDDETAQEINALTDEIRRVYVDLVARLSARGLNRKEARQAARCVLPNATETKLVVTGNMRAWRDVIHKRIQPAADAEIRVLAKALLIQLMDIAPNTFQDMRVYLEPPI